MEEALSVAIEKFKNISFESIPAKCGVNLKDDSARRGVEIKYLARWYLVSPDNITYLDRLGNFIPTGLEEKKQVSEREKIIILHYLTLSKRTPLSGKLIDFREIPGGNMYYSVFEVRVHQPFLALFGKEPSLFIEASRALEGEKIDFGDIAFKFMVLPRMPINFILHEGDEEFPPACKVLFDSSISDYLPTEDIVIVCEDVVRELESRTQT